MNAIKTLMLSMTFMVVSGIIYAEPVTLPENNVKLNQILAVDAAMNKEHDFEYFKHVLTGGGLYALVLALNTEVPDVAKSVEYVALFKKLDLANHLLTQILDELKKSNHLLSQNMPNKGVAMDE